MRRLRADFGERCGCRLLEDAAAGLQDSLRINLLCVHGNRPAGPGGSRHLGMALCDDLVAQLEVLLQRNAVLALEVALVRIREQSSIVALQRAPEVIHLVFDGLQLRVLERHGRCGTGASSRGGPEALAKNHEVLVVEIGGHD